MVEDDDRSALRPQGMIAGEILVPEDRVADDADLVTSVVDFVNWAMDRARLIFGEIATEAFWSYHVDYYLAQVANGGHGQFAHNSGMSEQSLDNCRRGLIAMGAEGYRCADADQDGGAKHQRPDAAGLPGSHARGVL